MPSELNQALELGLDDFPDRLRACREDADMTQRDLAVKCGLISYQRDGGSVAHWEAGRAFPSVPRLVVLCEVLNVTAGYLLYGGR